MKKVGRESMGRKTGEQEEVGIAKGGKVECGKVDRRVGGGGHCKRWKGRVWEGRQESRRSGAAQKVGWESMGKIDRRAGEGG